MTLFEGSFPGYTWTIIELKRRCDAAQETLHAALEKDGVKAPRLVHADRAFGVWDKDAAGNYLTDLVALLYRQKKYIAPAREIYLTGLAARYLSWLSDELELGRPLRAELIELALEAGAALKLLGYDFKFEADQWAENVLKVKAHYEDEEVEKSAHGKAKASLVAERVARAFGKTANAVSGFDLIKRATEEIESKNKTTK